MQETYKRLPGPSYMVHWKARSMTSDRSVFPTVVKAISQFGFAIELAQAVSRGKEVNIEIFLNFDGEEKRIRVKTTVLYCMILSENRGAYMEVSIKQISPEEMHVLNSVLQVLGNSPEFDLRL